VIWSEGSAASTASVVLASKLGAVGVRRVRGLAAADNTRSDWEMRRRGEREASEAKDEGM